MFSHLDLVFVLPWEELGVWEVRNKSRVRTYIHQDIAAQGR